MSALLTGLFLGGARFILEIRNKISPLSSDLLRTVATVNFLHYAAFLFLVCSVVLVVVSLATAPPPRERLLNLTYAGIDRSRPLPTKWNGVNAAVSVLLTCVLLFLWWTFR